MQLQEGQVRDGCEQRTGWLDYVRKYSPGAGFTGGGVITNQMFQEEAWLEKD